jgi:hypothetical protein
VEADLVVVMVAVLAVVLVVTELHTVLKVVAVQLLPIKWYQLQAIL